MYVIVIAVVIAGAVDLWSCWLGYRAQFKPTPSGVPLVGLLLVAICCCGLVAFGSIRASDAKALCGWYVVFHAVCHVVIPAIAWLASRAKHASQDSGD